MIAAKLRQKAAGGVLQACKKPAKPADSDFTGFVIKISNDPYGTRTRVTAVKGRCPRPLDEGAVETGAMATDEVARTPEGGFVPKTL